MDAKRILLMHFSNATGHHCASLAIEKALQKLSPDIQTCNIDAINYFSPLMGKSVYQLYKFVISTMPGIWDYLYDNKRVLQKLRKTRALVHKLNDKKIKKLLDKFKPDIVVCTQAFPSSMLGDYKLRHKLNLPLVGVLTDYAPHSYWLNDSVDIYIVPTDEVKQQMKKAGIIENRLKVLGIPINTSFNQHNSRQKIFRHLGLNQRLPVILVMGGGEGLGPIKRIVSTLDKLDRPVQLIIVCGRNKRLYQWLTKNKTGFNKPAVIFGYSDEVDKLMSISSLIVSKAGGLTVAEALSKSLPIVIAHPLPGQESRNTRFLLGNKVALKAEGLAELKSVVEEVLNDSSKLQKLRHNARELAQPDSAERIARFVLKLLK